MSVTRWLPFLGDALSDPRLFISPINTSDSYLLITYTTNIIIFILLLFLVLTGLMSIFESSLGYGNQGHGNYANYGGYGGGYGGAYNSPHQTAYNGGYTEGYARSQPRSLQTGYDAINVLYMLEEAFQKLEMSDLSCQQRAVCEAHLPNAQQTLGAVAAKLQDIMGSVDPQTVERSDSEAAKVYNMFRSAAVRGAQQQDCHVHFGSRCSRALGDHVRAKRKL